MCVIGSDSLPYKQFYDLSLGTQGSSFKKVKTMLFWSFSAGYIYWIID